MKKYYRSNFSKKITDGEIQRDLKNIYEDESGDRIDISRLEPSRKRGFFRFLIYLGVALLILAGVAWSGFWVFNKYAPEGMKQAVTDSGDIELKIEGPDKIEAGGEVKYIITYANKKKVALNNVSLNIRYPGGLILGSLKPEPKAKENKEANQALVREDNWDLGTLLKGESGSVEVFGRLVAETGTNQTLWTVLYYEPENFSSRFQREASFTTQIESTPVELKFSGNDQASTSGEVELTLAYINKTDHDLPNVLLEINYPEGFDLTSTEPSPVSGSDNQWKLEVLEKGGTGEIKIKGKFAANVKGGQNFMAAVSLQQAENQEYYLIAKSTQAVNVISGELLVELKINSLSTDSAVNFGDTLSYSLTYQNNSQDALQDLTASVFFTTSSDFIQWTTLNDRYEGMLDDFEAGKTLIWTKEEVPNLAELKPGEKGVIDFSVKLVSNASEMSGDLSLQSVASFKIGKIDDKEVNIESRSNSINVKLNSNLSLSAAGRYFNDSGTSIGSGPLPPKVGESTHYVILWELDNSVHEVKDIVVSTTLPKTVSWVSKKEITAGDLEYQPESRQVVWTINRMPTTIDIKYLVSFEISITPTEADAGKILALTGDNTLTAIDQVTAATVNQNEGAITTDLVSDPVAKGKGLVEK